VDGFFYRRRAWLEKKAGVQLVNENCTPANVTGQQEAITRPVPVVRDGTAARSLRLFVIDQVLAFCRIFTILHLKLFLPSSLNQ